MTNAYLMGFTKAATDCGFNSQALLKLAFNILGSPIGGFQSNWNGLKDMWHGNEPGYRTGQFVDAKQLIKNDQLLHDSVQIRPVNIVDNLRGRYNQWRQDRMMKKNPNMNEQQVTDMMKKYPNPYGTILNDKILDEGQNPDAAIKKVNDAYNSIK